MNRRLGVLTRVVEAKSLVNLVNINFKLTESELKAVRNNIPWIQEVNDFIKIYIKAYHDPQLTLKDDSEIGPIFQVGMLNGYMVLRWVR